MTGIERDPAVRLEEIRQDIELVGEVVAHVVRSDGKDASDPVFQAWLRLQFNVGYVCGENSRLRKANP